MKLAEQIRKKIETKVPSKWQVRISNKYSQILFTRLVISYILGFFYFDLTIYKGLYFH